MKNEKKKIKRAFLWNTPNWTLQQNFRELLVQTKHVVACQRSGFQLVSVLQDPGKQTLKVSLKLTYKKEINKRDGGMKIDEAAMSQFCRFRKHSYWRLIDS